MILLPQWATKVVETLLGNDAFRYLSICSILFAPSVNSLIPPAPQFNLGSLSKRTFQGDAVVKSTKARDSRRRS